MSLLLSLETAIKAMRANTIATNTVTHNVANMNNPDYSKQLANISAALPIDGIGSAGQLGTGSVVSRIERIRDLYLDKQIRRELENIGQWEILNLTYNNLRAVFPEVDDPSAAGINAQLDKFWAKWAELAAAPGDLAIRNEIYTIAQGLASMFNIRSSALTKIQIDLNSELRTAIEQVNTLTERIANLNKEIVNIYGRGQQPNDLLDNRDAALADLSKLVNVFVGYRSDGSIILNMQGHTLVNGGESNKLTWLGGEKDSKFEDVGIYEYKGAPPVRLDNDIITSGRVGGLLKSRDEVISWYQTQLDMLAHSLIYVVNKIHRTGLGSTGVQGDMDIFSGVNASNISINPLLGGNGANIADTKYKPGDIAEIMANMQNMLINNWVTSSTPATYTSTTTLGRSGQLDINGTIVNFNATDTIASFINKVNVNPSKFGMVFDETNHKFFMVGNSLFNIKETDTTAVPWGLEGPETLLWYLRLYQEKASAAPMNYFGAMSVNPLVGGQSFAAQELILNTEATDTGKLLVVYRGTKYTLNWDSADRISDVRARIHFFSGGEPMMHGSQFPADQKYYFSTGWKTITDAPAPGARDNDYIAPFTINDASGNMTIVMNMPNNVRFGDLYDSVLGKLTGEIESSEAILKEYQDAYNQLKGMQDNITGVNEEEEVAKAKAYQRAHDAAVRLAAIVDQMMNMLINRTASPSDSDY